MSLILSGTDGLSDVDGSAATPAIRGTDANTGIFFPAADTIAFSEGGVESMRIDSSGNVGIGTSSPAQKLDVRGSNTTLRIGGDTNDIGTIQFFETTGSTINASIAANREIAAAGGYLTFSTKLFSGSLTERMRIDSSGNVLIGTTTNTGKLVAALGGGHVFNTELNNSVLGSSNGVLVSNYLNATTRVSAINFAADSGTDGSLIFGTASSGTLTERMRIDSAGKVLVGQTSSSGSGGIQSRTGFSCTTTNNEVSGLFVTDSNADNSLFIGADQGNLRAGSYIALGVDATERMRINSSGNVGIGTSSPNEKLQVVGKVSATTFYGGGQAVTAAVANTYYKVQDGYFGIYVFRDSSLGGTALVIYDPNGGANIINSTIANFQAQNNGGNLEIRVTASAPRLLYWVALSAVNS